MFRWFVNWCIGSRDYRIDPGNAKRAAALLVKSGAQGAMRSEDGWLCFSLPLPEGKSFEKLLSARGIAYEATEHGLIRLLGRYKRRPGILIGLIIFFAIITVSRNYVWNIEVEGNSEVSASEICGELESLGFRVGTYIPDVDFDRLHSEFLQSDRRFAWVSVNMFGTHATVEVREALRPAPVPDEDTPYNLIAAEDGIIDTVYIYRGTKLKSAGEPVKAGELLASGVVETKTGYRLVHARGEVKASVKRGIRVEVPLERDKKVYTGREFRESSIKILGFSLKIFKSTGNPSSTCDIIDRERKLCIFGVLEVPVTICERVSREYLLETEQLTFEAAKAEAFEKLRSECAEIDGELASREVSAGLEGGVYVIDCRLRVITDIAVEQEIYR